MSRALFLGSALHTALGTTLADCVDALRQPPSRPGSIACRLDAGADAIPYFLLSGLPGDDPMLRLQDVLYRVIERALEAAALTSAQRRNLAFFLGSSSFDIGGEERRFGQALQRNPGAIPLPDCGMAQLSESIRNRLGLKGADFTFNTACTSSANALWYACKLVEAGAIETALVLGVEFVNSTTTYGFQGLQLLSPTTMRPFEVNRDGLVLGESCAAMVLGKSAEPRGFFLRGAANTCDTYSMSTTREDGTGTAEVMAKALEDAGLRPEQIDAIKCHGTATLSGDAAESNGMLATFQQLPPCTTFKPFIGHTLGACGLTELILFCQAAEHGFLPGTPGLVPEDAQRGFILNQQPMPLDAGNFMLNYFGFGGNSTSLVVSNRFDGAGS